MAEPKIMALRRPDVCVECGTALDAATRAEWNPSLKAVTCLACVEKRTAGAPEQPSAEPPHAEPSFERGMPGASARRKYDKLHNQREEHAKQKLGQEFEVDVRAALCFVDAEWSLFAKPFRLEGVWVGWAKALGQQLLANGPLEGAYLMTLARRVARDSWWISCRRS